MHIVTSVLLFSLAYYILTLTEEHVPKPYMDEVFHIPQAQHYCRFELLTWDEKITTLPGLYLTSALNHWISSVSCSVEKLRTQNVLFYAICFFVLFWLVREEALVLRTIKSLRIVMFPLLFSFSYLYYTDVGSTLFVLIAYLSYKRENINLSALFSLISVLYRQTNIIWAFWIACQYVIDRFDRYQNVQKDKEKETQQLMALLRFLYLNFVRIAKELRWFILLGLSFIIFVFINGGIVVGDRSNHQVILHVTQIFYFASFCSVMLPFHFLSYLKSLFTKKDALWRTLLIVIITSPFVAYLSYRFSYIHKFILSDNRHFVFYIWRRLFKVHVSPSIPLRLFALYSPFFTLSILFIIHLLRESRQTKLWIITYFVCTCLNLIPLPLIEFRYFLIPYIILSISEKHQSTFKEFATLLYYLAVNSATTFLFLYRPFIGPDGEQARFMW